MVPPPYQVLNPQVQAQTDRAVAQIEATVPYPLSTRLRGLPAWEQAVAWQNQWCTLYHQYGMSYLRRTRPPPSRAVTWSNKKREREE